MDMLLGASPGSGRVESCFVQKSAVGNRAVVVVVVLLYMSHGGLAAIKEGCEHVAYARGGVYFC